ncbi:MAG: TM0106 family RecB-like putative nuclease, partial [Actinomycetes bacterium]
MFVRDDQVLWSASDLTRATECEFALLRELDVKLRRAEATPAEPDALLEKIAALGDRHEAAELDRLRRQHGPYDPASGRGVREIERPDPYRPDVLLERQEETLEALKGGADVVYQGAFFDGRFHGFADFLVREDGTEAYRVCDAKLARHEQPKALLQLAAYADQLERNGILVAAEAELLLGNGRRALYPIAEIGPVFRERRERLLAMFDRHVASGGVVVWGSGEVMACGRCDVCATEVAARRDLLLVAGMRATQRRKLVDAGVTTIDELAGYDGSVPHLAPATLAKLTAQAALQVAQTTGADGRPVVTADVFAPEHLRVLPPPSEGDLFFDFEGDPMWNDGDLDEWGLEYLFGVTELPTGTAPATASGTFAPFRAFWAHDRAGEKKALQDFVAFVEARRKEHPDLHVYHYAAYEKSALTRLALRHATCEDVIDDWLRQGLLVDLYAVVRGALRVSQPSYSIKKLEPLYMGDDLRDGDVTDAAASIVEYHAYCDARDGGEAERADELLAAIRDYNNYDCESTLRLRDWLLARAAEHGVTPQGTLDDAADTGSRASDTANLEAALRQGVPDQGRTDDQQARAMLAAAVGFNRREQKPFWWAHFDRLGHPVAVWGDERDVFVAESAELVGDWAPPSPRSRAHRRVRLVGRWGAGSNPTTGDEVRSVYDAPTADAHDVPAKCVLGVMRSAARLTEVSGDDEGRDVVVLDETLPKAAEPYAALPVALVPGSTVPMGRIDGAIQEIAQRVVSVGLVGQPALDILRRRRPQGIDGELPRTGDTVRDIVAAVRSLDRSYLAVQGPPGTGKTHTGSRVIAHLVNELGWKVGVVSQGHATVEHMLDGVVKAGVPADRVGKKTKNPGVARPWRVLKDTEYARFLAESTAGCVVGGTAWDFANADRVGRDELDLLVIDEAGQFTLAHTLGVSVAARRLLLLGDPQQLPQVIQGTHPEP